MIVRISGEGQYDLDDSAAHNLSHLDSQLTSAVHAAQEQEFHRVLHEIITFVRQNGKPVPGDAVVPSEVIIPPDDVTLTEAKDFFTDEGLMHPLPA